MDLYRLEINTVPKSLNEVGPRSHWRVWSEAKKLWQAELTRMLEYAEVPKDRPAWTATAQLRFPVRRRRDSDNFTFFLSKAFGDAMHTGGWIDDDTPQFFQFEPVCFDPERGPERVVVLLVEGVQPSLFEGAWELAENASD